MVPVNTGRRVKTSIYGGVSNVLELPLFAFHSESTNKEDFLQFLKDVKEEVAKVTPKKLHIIMDNHQVSFLLPPYVL